MPAQDLSELKHLLRRLPPGDIPEALREEIIGRLQNCWHEFSGSRKTNMKMDKLPRAKELVWRPPSLCFKIARHGGTVLGSTREPIHHWEVNLEEKTAHQTTTGFRQLHPTAPRLSEAEMTAIARRVCDTVQAGPGSNLKLDVHLIWIDEAEFRIRPSSLVPADGFRQTVEGRRRRMKVILQREIEANGFVFVGGSGAWLRFRKAGTPVVG
jgi:hypothetical protein